MAEFGPAIFQVFADMVKFDSKGFVKKTKLSEYKFYDFNTEGFKNRKRAKIARKRMEALKSAIFKVIMLRARNDLIKKMICEDTTDLKECTVKLEINFTDDIMHLTAKDFKEKAEKLNEQGRKELKLFRANEKLKIVTEEDVKKYCGSENFAIRSNKIIQSTIISFRDDELPNLSDSNIQPAIDFCNTKQAACGSRNDRVNLALKGQLAKFRIKPKE